MSLLPTRFLLALALLAPACAFVDKDRADARLDPDGDGVEWPDDCDDTDPDVGGESEWFPDLDGDGFGAGNPVTTCDPGEGYAAVSGDCDEADAQANPGVAEICDGVDNDCDGAVDEAGDPVGWFRDHDEDGFGDPSTETVGCTAPGPEWILDGQDCDDTRAAVRPDADEECDGRDNDCDGLIDEDDAVDAATWYRDQDEDGYGTDEETAQGCDQPEGYSAYGGDCDDTDPAFNPGAEEDPSVPEDRDCDGYTGYEDADGDGFAAVDDCDEGDAEVNPDATEVCDGVDNDCDGDIDEADAADALTWYADDDGDGFGDPSDMSSACDQPSGYVSDSTDCDDGDDSVYPGAFEVCDVDDVDEDCNGLADDDDPSVDARTYSAFHGDSDEDGYGDADALTEACDEPDGTTPDSSDCDDTRADVNPGAPEVCDGVDNDCDGLSDDEDGSVDANTFNDWYADDDIDGFGDPSAHSRSCDAGSGEVSDNTDCDDTRADVNPDEDEICDEDDVDEDCNGQANDDDSSVDTGTYSDWYDDSDGDGFGDADAHSRSCDPDGNQVADHTDCDDADRTVNPAATEVCDADDVDEDCDGLSDDADSSVDSSTFSTFYSDTDGDGYGDASAPQQACGATSGLVADDTDCDDGDGSSFPGGTESCDGADNDCDSGVDEGVTNTYYADSDGDGYGDGSSSVQDCSAPGGYVTDDTDCDDTDTCLKPLGTVTVGASGACDYTIIQDALDDVCELQTVEIRDARTYYENLDMYDKELTLENASGGQVTIDGGGTGTPVLSLQSGTVEGSSDEMVITNGVALDGGGIYITGSGSVVLANLIVEDNLTVGKGGGLYSDSTGDLVIHDTEFSGNLAGTNGGGLYVYGATLDLFGLDVTDNVVSSGSGGGLYLYTVTNSNTGAFEDLVIEGNYARDNGGGMYLNAAGTGSLPLDMLDVLVDSNTVESAGGGAYVTSSFVDWAGGSLNDNSSAGYQGAAHVSSTTMSIDDLEVDGNNCVYYGNFRVNGGSFAMQDATFSDNSANHYGSALRIDNASATLVDIALERNHTNSYYGAFYYNGSSSDTLTIDGMRIVGGSSRDYYEHSAHIQGPAEICDLVIAGNTGDGLHWVPSTSSDTLELSHATIVGNTGDGLVLEPSFVNQVEVSNSIIAFNEGYGISNNPSSGSFAPTLTYNNVYDNAQGDYDGVSAGSHDLSVDPAFIAFDADGPSDVWDLHLYSGSPMFNAGDPSSPTNYDGSQAHMGAYAGQCYAVDWYADSDGDGLPDGWEADYGVSGGANDDEDGDGLDNIDEYAAGSRPDMSDTDRDGYDDAAEVADGTNVLVPEPYFDAQLTGADAGDYAGAVVAAAGDINQDGYDDLYVTAYRDDNSGGTDAGAVYVFYGPVTSDLSVSSADATLTGESSSDYAGNSVASAGDVNGDGVPDLIVGAQQDDDGGTNAGAAYLVLGPPSSGSLADAEAKLIGEDASDYAGWDVAGAGDVNQDGYADLLIGARYDDDGGTNAGAAYLVLGPVSGSMDLSQADAKLRGESSSDYAGAEVAAAGDVDADGVGDLLVGAYLNDDGASDAGAVYLFTSAPSGAVSLGNADATLTGEASGDYAGISVASAGDVDSDGYGDLIIGAYGYGTGGAAYLVRGPVTGDMSLSLADAKLLGEHTGDNAGWRVDGAGDFDGDGDADLLIGAYGADYNASGAGAAYVVLSPVSGTVSLSAADHRFVGESANDYFGHAVAGVGDTDGDGYGDVLVGAYGNDDGGTTAGAAYLIRGF